MPAPTFLDLARSIDRQLHGNIQYPVKNLVFVDSPYSVLVDDDFLNFNATGGNSIVTLPDATLYPGIPFGVKKTDASTNTVTVGTTGGQTIDGAATKVLVNQNDFIVAVSDGTNWKLYAVTISAAAASGAVFYQIEKIVKTDGISTFVPVDGTLINFTVAVDGECAFWAGGEWTGSQVFAGGSLNFRVDGVDYAPESFSLVNGAGGDVVGAQSLSPHISLFLTAGPHTVELVASESGISLNASASDPLTLSVLFPGASASVASPTPKAATFVVHPTPGIGDYTTIQAALTAIGPLGGGYILVREGTYDELLTYPLDAPIVMRGCGDNTILAPSSAGETFAFPDGLAGFTNIVIEDMRIAGDDTLAQTLFAYKDVNSYWRLITNRLHVTGVRVIDDIQAREGTFTNVFRTRHYNPTFVPTTSAGNNVLSKTTVPANTFGGATSIHYTDAVLGADTGGTEGWKADYDGDWTFHGSCYITLEANTLIDGFESDDNLTVFGTAALTLTNYGSTWDAYDIHQSLQIVDPITLNIVAQYGSIQRLVLSGAGSHLVLTGDGWDIRVQQVLPPATNTTGVLVDVVASADFNKISGYFMNGATTALIRTAALKTVIGPSVFNISTGSTVLETGSADFTEICDSYGLANGSGLTIIGTSSKVKGALKASAATSSTNALVAIVPTIANPLGLQGVGWIKNTDGANSIDVKESFTDAFGTTSTLTTTVTFGTAIPLSLGIAIGTGLPPYVSYKVEVIDTVAGNHATYVSNFTSQGAQ